MDFDFSSALARVRGAMIDAATSASRRRLTVLQGASCEKGCSGCCRRLIRITVAEAIILQEHLEKTGTWVSVVAKCSEVLNRARESSDLAWFRMNIPCPILSNDECLAYSVRPAACSLHFSLSKPSLCHPWTTEEGKYQAVELDDIFKDFRKILHSCMDGHGILSLNLPLPVSLLMAERIRHQPHLTPEALVRMMFNELA